MFPTIAPLPVAFIHASRNGNFELCFPTGLAFWKSGDLSHMTLTQVDRSDAKKVNMHTITDLGLGTHPVKVRVGLGAQGDLIAMYLCCMATRGRCHNECKHES